MHKDTSFDRSHGSSFVTCMAANDNSRKGNSVSIELLAADAKSLSIEAEIFASLLASLHAANDNGDN